MNFYELFTLLENNLEELKPLQKIGEGNFAVVYSTQNPNIVMRIESRETLETCEKFMMSPKIQATGGVAKIFGTKIADAKDYFPQEKGEIIVTYKEFVNTNWHQILAQKHSQDLKQKYDISKILEMMPYGKETAEIHGEVSAFLQLTLEKFRTKSSIIMFLSLFPEAEGLVKAINLNLPINDLHSGNLGLNLKGNLVVIDC